MKHELLDRRLRERAQYGDDPLPNLAERSEHYRFFMGASPDTPGLAALEKYFCFSYLVKKKTVSTIMVREGRYKGKGIRNRYRSVNIEWD